MTVPFRRITFGEKVSDPVSLEAGDSRRELFPHRANLPRTPPPSSPAPSGNRLTTGLEVCLVPRGHQTCIHHFSCCQQLQPEMRLTVMTIHVKHNAARRCPSPCLCIGECVGGFLWNHKSVPHWEDKTKNVPVIKHL